MKLVQSVLAFTVLMLLVTLTSCSKKPEEINYNSDECNYCTMHISDDRYAAEIIIDKDKVYKFDSIECLIGYALVKNIIENDSVSFYVCDYMNPGKFLEVGNSCFVHNNGFMSPMGLNIQTFSSQSESEKFVKENGGDEINWDDVVNMVKESAQ